MIGCFNKSREIIRESVFEQNKKRDTGIKI